jgi:hypothetical protein
MRSVALALLIVAGPAAACGYCVEDKIAAVYDHQVVTRARETRHEVVFLHVDGKATRQALEQAAYAAGADRGTVRVSADLLTVSFALDPGRNGLGRVHPAMEKRLKGVSLMPFEVIK